PAEMLYVRPDVLQREIRAWPRVNLEELTTLDSEIPGGRAERVTTRLPFELRATRLLREEKGFADLAQRIREWTRRGTRVALVVGNAAQAERLKHILEGQKLIVPALGETLPEVLERSDAPGAFILQGELSESIELPDDDVVCIAETNLFGEHRHTRRRKSVALTLDQVMRSLEQLKPQDYIVHLDHGIGIYHGLKHMTVGGIEGDFLHLEYQGGDRLYLPVDRVNLVQKYVGGDGAQPVLDKLGSNSWER